MRASGQVSVVALHAPGAAWAAYPLHGLDTHFGHR
ncbi:hypothetical protein PI125_g12930 [Phytophthora idaei]|nr:hypothetical protein PI125_g12930 [Phytophthora idaei]